VGVAMRTRDAGQRLSIILVLALWFGLVTGLVEWLEQTLLQALGIMTWQMRPTNASYRILLVAPAFYALLFCVFGLMLWAVSRVAKRMPILRVCVFSFAGLLFLDALILMGRLQKMGEFALAVGLAAALTRWFTSHSEQALRFWRRSLVWVAVASLMGLLGVEAGGPLAERFISSRLPAAPAGAPNILVIVIDTLRADHLSSYGYPRQTTPHIDGIAREGVQFDAAVAGSSWTLPSHASLLTGLYPSQHEAQLEPLPEGKLMISEVLIDRGYRTGVVSANQLLFTRAQGFNRGFVHFDDSFSSPLGGISRTLYGSRIVKRAKRLFHLQDEGFLDRRRAPNVTSAALDWISRDRTRPFLLVLNYIEPHDPYVPPQPWRSKFSNKKEPGGLVNESDEGNNPRLTPEQQQDEIDAYDGSIAFADDQIGRLVSALDRQGLRENTIIVITSDHGEGLGQHGLQTHGLALYWETIHVPLILRWPGHVPAGVRVSEPVSQVAVSATLLDLIGMGHTVQLPGRSLAATWQPPGTPQNLMKAESELAKLPFSRNKGTPAYDGAMKSLVQGPMHYIWHEEFGSQLYNWQKDPAEMRDLARTPEGQHLAADFAAELGVRLKDETPDKQREGSRTGSK
jgi:arylsulfatase A-like enzyme